MNRSFVLALALVPHISAAQEPTTLTLEEAIAQAKEKQPSIAQAQAQVEITEVRTEQLKVAQNLQVDFSANASLAALQQLRFGFQQAGFGNSLFNLNYSSSVDLRWLLYDFGKNEARITAAEGNTISAQKDLNTLYANLIFGVAQAYYGLWVAQESLVLAEEALSKVKIRVETAQALYDAGARPKIEVARASLDQANAEVDKARAIGEVTRARTALASSMGTFGARYAAVKPPGLTASPSMEEAIQSAYEARPEVAALRAQREAAEHQLKVARLTKKPDLVGSASASLFGPANVNDRFIPLLPSFSAQVVFSMPLYDGGAAAAQIKLAQAQLRLIDAQLDLLRIDVSSGIEDAYTAYQTATAARVAAEEATKFAIENESLAKGRYDAGAGSAIEISDAEVALVQAKTFELQARAEEGIARLRIEFVLGRLTY